MEGRSDEWQKLFIISVVLLCVFLFLGYSYNNLTSIDLWLMKHVWYFRTEWLTPAMFFITDLGSKYVTLPLMYILVIYFLIKRNPKLSLLIIFNLIGAREMNKWLKTIYNRTRPNELPLIHESGLSFPSGHSMNSAAFIGFLGYLLWKHLRNQGEEAGYILVLTWMLVGLIGFSRVYLGVHFPSDIVGGFTAGGLWLILTVMVMKRLNIKVGST
ncbi:phosphatase PAP2 family protein [Pseudalkalibacillus sp. SCS-8]|uniref:phosphatase PAP2 family protein n=1 Tax=Pseudalkalibacillus nanhaiensis TaxID=3115291 RepID=UPI0032D9BF84